MPHSALSFTAAAAAAAAAEAVV
ncbi:unnamed protein product, partial [Ophioblennius macclurei]